MAHKRDRVQAGGILTRVAGVHVDTRALRIRLAVSAGNCNPRVQAETRGRKTNVECQRLLTCRRRFSSSAAMSSISLEVAYCCRSACCAWRPLRRLSFQDMDYALRNRMTACSAMRMVT